MVHPTGLGCGSGAIRVTSAVAETRSSTRGPRPEDVEAVVSTIIACRSRVEPLGLAGG